MQEQPPNSPFLVDLKPVPTVNAFAYIPNMNSYIQDLIVGSRSVCLLMFLQSEEGYRYNRQNISMETELVVMGKMFKVHWRYIGNDIWWYLYSSWSNKNINWCLQIVTGYEFSVTIIPGTHSNITLVRLWQMNLKIYSSSPTFFFQHVGATVMTFQVQVWRLNIKECENLLEMCHLS